MSEAPSALPVQHPRRRWIRTVIFGVVMLLCGALIGSGLTLRVLWGGLLANVRQPEKMTERIVKRIDRRLDLNEDQARKWDEDVKKFRRFWFWNRNPSTPPPPR